jgi:hypothetical protein
MDMGLPGPIDRQLVERELWDSLSGSSEAGAGGLYRLGVGRVGQQPQGKVLQAYARRAETTGEGRAGLGASYSDCGAVP